MMKKHSQRTHLCRLAAAALFLLPGTGFHPGSGLLHAQQSLNVAKLELPSLLSNSSTPEPSLLHLTEDGIAYSSSTGAAELTAATDFVSAGEGGGQPAPRRRYGRPNYSDRMHNADGSSKFTALVGGGLTIPVSSPSTKYLKTSWKLQGGVGYNLNKKAALILQFDYDNFALPGNLITSQRAVYNSQNFMYQGGGTVDFSGLDGHAHDWSFTLNPTFNFYQSDSFGAYAVVGGGFYHKVTDFTLPQQGVYYDPYYGYVTYQANQTFDQYVSNSAGVNGGVGFTYRPSRFASERLYAEARYVFNFNSQRAGNAINLFPGNSATTSYLPITVGIRF